MSDLLIGRNQFDRLLEALLRVSALHDSDVRDLLTDEVAAILRRPLDATRFVDARHDLSSLVNACVACSGGLRTFAGTISRRHPGESSAQALALATDIVGPAVLSRPDREALRVLLAEIPVGQIADAVGELVNADDLRTLQSWRDIPAAIRALERLPLPDDEVPQLLTFVDRLAHVVTDSRSAGLRQWTDTVAGGLGVDAERLGRLRAASERGVAVGRLVTATSRPGPVGAEPVTARRAEDAALIWGGVPIRNRNFTGRVVLLDRLADVLRTSSKASVLPQALHGMGGVGKTQLVTEYVYRHLDEYDLVWWIPAEQTASVLTALTQLADRLGLPTTEDRQQTARNVLDALAGANLSWLLVYDNADAPSALDQYVPTTGGHVILTTRNHEWAGLGRAIEVDVFERGESIELLQRRSLDDRSGLRISTAEADELADKLGDLPLALEQAAAWYLATAMPVREYLALLDSHIRDLLSEGKPANYPATVAALVTVALEQLRANAPATAQLFELFAYLGGEPVAISLLRSGKEADISEPLRATLGASIPLSRIVRDLSRYGLAKVDAAQRIQVHRLVQRVLRESLTEEMAGQTLRNARNLLAAANPGDPDEHGELDRQREMGPHLEPADMIHADDPNGRQAVLDHARYLYVVGDYENSRQLAARAEVAWVAAVGIPRLGPDGEQTLLARGQVANAYRTLGESSLAAPLVRDAYDRMRRNPDIGPRHEFTLITGTQIGADLRIAGRYSEALEFDRESLGRHREVFGPGDTYTLRAQTNLAVDLRMIGAFTEALRLDREVAEHWEDVGRNDPRALSAYLNMARSYYGMGAYAAGLALVERWLPELQNLLVPGHSRVLLGGRIHAILLRKTGRLAEAAEVLRENHERVEKRFGSPHEFSVAATVSYANVLRELDDLEEADRYLADALSRYKTNFGPSHPLTLVAEVNSAILNRARGEPAAARAIDERCYAELTQVLGAEHPYTVCAGASLATDHALAGEYEQAVALSTGLLSISRALDVAGREERDGADHPYVLLRAVNLSHDLRALGEVEQAAALFDESLAGLRLALGSRHPEVVAVEQGRRTEGDIESPPT